jgi:hypothetical protein
MAFAASTMACSMTAASSGNLRNDPSGTDTSKVQIERLHHPEMGGEGYKLIYLVEVPIAVYWKFKTDFDNVFLLDNKFIREHRFIKQKGRNVITENKYTYGRDVYFRWQTTVHPEKFRLDFVLINPRQSKQNFHFGYIQLSPVLGGGTRVTQVAYFDFWGASFWAVYPWKGGMKDHLTYTAQWEQETVLRLKDHYSE